VGCQILKGDYAAAPLQHFDARRQVFGYRIGQRHFTSLDHIGQHQRREYLGYRTNLEYRVAVQRTLIAFIKTAVANEPTAFRLDNTHYDPDTLVFLIDSFRENLADFRVRRNGRFRRRLR